MSENCPKIDSKINRRRRRRDYRRLKKKRKHYWAGLRTERERGFVANTPHPCSCMGCGNQRKHCGPTRQEIKHELRDQESI